MKADDTGNLITSYERHQRLPLILTSVVSGSAAAVCWWLAARYDGSWIVPVLAIPATALSLMTFHFLGRTIAPGKRIAIFEEGILIGKKFVEWETIEKLGFSLFSVTRQETLATHEELKLHFHLKNGKIIELQMSDVTLPFHINVPEFLALVEDRGIPVIDELSPQEIRENAGDGSIVRNPELAEILNREFAEVFSLLETGNGRREVIASVMDSLAAGEKERQQLRKRLGVDWLKFKALEIIGIIFGFVLFLSLVPLGASALNEFLDLFRETGDARPEWWPAPLLVAATIATWWCGTKCWKLVDYTGKKSRHLKSNFQSIRQPEPATESELTGDYALYLRSFSAEFFRYLQTTENRGRDGLAIKYETLERELDKKIASAISDLDKPLLALANSRDASAPETVRTLYITTPNWVKLAALLMWHSRLTILNLSAVTESVLAELRALHTIKAHQKTIVVIGEDFDPAFLSETEQEILKTFPHQVTEDCEGLPQLARSLI